MLRSCRHINDHIIQIRGWVVCFYIIYTNDALVLIDGGFIGDLQRLDSTLRSIGRTFKDIDLILLTHGHLDHTANIASIKKKSKAVVACHPLDEDHIAGTYPYTGNAKVCGWLEAVGRGLLHYQPVS